MAVELIERIRKVNPNARIILLSGFVEPLGLTEENTGADAVIAKSANEAGAPGALGEAPGESRARAQAAGSAESVGLAAHARSAAR